MPKGQQKLEQALIELLQTKQDAIVLIPAIVGKYDAIGNKQINVIGRPAFVHVRVHGQLNEVWEVYNDVMGLSFGMPVYLTKDITTPRQFKIYGRNNTIQQSNSADTSVVMHGKRHSADNASMVGKDLAWIYRRQLVQPLLCQPQSPADVTVYVNPDYYSWKNNFVYFAGGNSPDLTTFNPAAGRAKYVTVYLNGDTNLIGVEDTGGVFDETYPPASVVTYIPEVSQTIGIPLAAIKLTSATTVIGWENIIDLRIFLYTATGSNFKPTGSAILPVTSGSSSGSSGFVPDASHQHALSVANGLIWDVATVKHSNAVAAGTATKFSFDAQGHLTSSSTLMAADVSVNAAGFTKNLSVADTNVQLALATIDQLDVSSITVDIEMFRWFAATGTTVLNLPDYALGILSLTIDGTTEDALNYSLNLNGYQIDIAALAGDSVVQSIYSVRII